VEQKKFATVTCFQTGHKKRADRGEGEVKISQRLGDEKIEQTMWTE